MKNTLQLLKEFCENYFVKCSEPKVISLITDDIVWIGALNCNRIVGKLQAKRYIENKFEKDQIPYGISFSDEELIENTGVGLLRVSLTHGDKKLYCDINGVSCAETSAENKLCYINMSWLDELKEVQEENSSTATYLYKNKACELLSQSDGFSALIGYDKDEYKEMVSKGLDYCVFSDDISLLTEALDKASLSDDSASVSYRALQKDGGLKWISADLKKTGTAKDAFVIQAICTSLPLQNEMYQLLVDESESGIIVRDAHTYKLLYTNKAAQRIMDIKKSNYIGKKCHEYFSHSKKPCSFCNASDYHKGEFACERLYVPHLNKYLSKKGTVIDFAGRVAIVEYLDDMTTLEKSERRIGDLVQNVACGLAICFISKEHNMELQYLNDGFFTIYEGDRALIEAQYRKNRLIGVHKDDANRLQKILNDVKNKFKGGEVTYRYISESGVLKWISAKYKVSVHPDGTATAYTTYFDISEQMRIQQRFSDVIHTVPCGICLYSWDGRDLRPLIANRQLSEMFGTDALTLLSGVKHMHFTHVHPEDIEGLKNASINALTKTHKIDHTYRALNCKTNSYIWIRERGSSVQQEDGSWLVYVSYYDVTQEHNTEQTLRESENLLEYATEHAGLWYWRYDARLDRAYLNTRKQMEFDVPPVLDNFVDTWLAKGYIHPDYEETYRDAMRRIKEGEKQVVFEAKLYMRDSTLHWGRLCFTNLFDDKGNVTITVCTAIFIDAEKELHAKYELEKRKPSLGEKTLLVHALFNLTTGETLEYAYRDGTTVPLNGRTVFTGENDYLDTLLIDNEERDKFRAINDKAFLLESFANGTTEFSIDYRRLMPGGEIVWVRNILHLVRDPDSSDVLLFEYCYDVEEEKMRGLMYKSLATDNYDYVVKINAKNHKYSVLHKANLVDSQSDLHIYKGEDADDVSLALANSIVIPDDMETVIQNTLIKGIKKNLENNERFQFTFRTQSKDGQIHYKKITQYYIDRQREIIVMFREDVTALIQSEANKNEMLASALAAANQASNAKSQFLSRMSHELRTPMNAIIGLSALAANDVNDPRAMEDAIGKIGLSARYLLSLINDILEMSRIESGRTTLNEGAFDFEQLIFSVNNIIFGQAAEKGVDYDAVVNSFMEPNYLGDATKLQQILVNVLGNAVKFTPKGGKVILAVEQLQRTNGHATLRFVVSDTGIGIDEKFIPHLFDAFAQESDSFTSTSTGTGLGLAITKNLVEMMNGHISVQSVKNVGSTFTIELQLGILEQSRRRLDMVASMNLSKLKALVVDDDVIVCQGTKHILSEMGIKAEWVDSGPKAVERVKERRDSKEDFDMVFIDWKMPDMDGIETTRVIRKIVGPEVTIIIMTAYDWRAIESQARAAGVDMFMEKPLFQSSIENAFEKIFYTHKDKIEIKSKIEYDLSGKRLLLAEDHPLNIEVAKRLLEKNGAQVIVANNGLEALEAYATSEDNYFDAILMDIRMPVLDGLTAAKSIRNMKKTGSRTIPIIAMTANAFDEDVKQSLSHGMDAHLTKPIEAQVMMSTLQRLIK